MNLAGRERWRGCVHEYAYPACISELQRSKDNLKFIPLAVGWIASRQFPKPALPVLWPWHWFQLLTLCCCFMFAKSKSLNSLNSSGVFINSVFWLSYLNVVLFSAKEFDLYNLLSLVYFITSIYGSLNATWSWKLLCMFSLFIVFWNRVSVALAVLELPKICLLSTRIRGMHHHPWEVFCCLFRDRVSL